MAIILALDTSTQVCSLCISDDGKIIFNKESFIEHSHASLLAVFIQEGLHFLKDNNKNVDAVAVSMGPGSYTGLRIGVSAAKGLCYALEIPLIAIPTLQIIAFHAKLLIEKNNYFTDKEIFFIPMIDARRMEVYAAIYDGNFDVVSETQAIILDEDYFSNLPLSRNFVIAGNGAEKCKLLIQPYPNIKYLPDCFPLAQNMVSFSHERFNLKQFEDTAYFEPFYLKDFVAKAPVVKGLKNKN